MRCCYCEEAISRGGAKGISPGLNVHIAQELQQGLFTRLQKQHVEFDTERAAERCSLTSWGLFCSSDTGTAERKSHQLCCLLLWLLGRRKEIGGCDSLGVCTRGPQLGSRWLLPFIILPLSSTSPSHKIHGKPNENAD